MHNLQSSWNYPYPSLYGNQNAYQPDMMASPSINNHYGSSYKDSNGGNEEQHIAPGHAFHQHSSDYEYDYNVRQRHPKNNQEHHQHAHVEVISSHKNVKTKRKSSVITALTLISFLFFINLLQNCLKENMLTLNPTVMIMTARVSRGANNHFDYSKESIENDIVESNYMEQAKESSTSEFSTEDPVSSFFAQSQSQNNESNISVGNLPLLPNKQFTKNETLFLK